MLKKVALAAAVALTAGLGIALAQTYPPPQVLNVNPAADLVQVIPNGGARAGNQYAVSGQITGAARATNGGVASTAFTHTFAAGEMYFYIQPSGTLATGTLTAEPNPGAGQRECFYSTQTQTALTWTANTGQTMGGSVPTAGVANTLQCIIYDTATATWNRIQ